MKISDMAKRNTMQEAWRVPITRSYRVKDWAGLGVHAATSQQGDKVTTDSPLF